MKNSFVFEGMIDGPVSEKKRKSDNALFGYELIIYQTSNFKGEIKRVDIKAFFPTAKSMKFADGEKVTVEGVFKTESYTWEGKLIVSRKLIVTQLHKTLETSSGATRDVSRECDYSSDLPF